MSNLRIAKTAVVAAFAALFFMGCGGGAKKVKPAAPVMVKVSFAEKSADGKNNRYKVEGAQGADEAAAVKSAQINALIYAGKELTGIAAEKNAVSSYLKNPAPEVLAMSGKGSVFKRMFTPDGSGVAIGAMIDVNIPELETHLTGKKLITSAKALAKGIGNPTLLVTHTKRFGNEKNVQLTDLGNITRDKIAGFLTAKRWNMVDESAVEQARKRQDAMSQVAGVIEDPVAQIAMLTGADIYVTYSAVASKGGQTHVSVSLKAFDVATGQLLASTVGESQRYMKSHPVSSAATEAAGNAIDKVFENLSGYWAEDVQEGRKYIIKINGDFSNRKRGKAVREVLKDLGTWKKTVKTENTIAGVLRSKEDTDDIADDLIDGVKAAGFKNTRYIVESRSLFIMEAN